MGLRTMRALICGAMLAFIATIAGSASAAERPVLVGYFPAFKGLDARLASTPIDHYSHINVAFANPDATGALMRDGTMTCMPGGADGNVTVAALKSAASRLRARGARVLLSVAGGVIPECSGDWATLLGSDRRDIVRRDLVAIVAAAGLDGIDIDIEGELLTRIDRAGDYTPFIAALSRDLKARGKLLTVATASYEGGMIPVGSIRYFDLVMPMSYDAIGPSWGTPGSEHATVAQAERDVALWLARGVPRERLALGMPYYGYGFGNHAPRHDFRALLAAHPDAARDRDVIGAACAGCDYITFNSVATIARKARIARAWAGGAMVWEITQDTDDQLLARTIAAGLAAAPAN